MTLSRLALLFALLPAAADAGAWARDAGGTFVALSTERDGDGNRYDGLYAEYGLGDRVTLGAEIGHSGGVQTSALVWMQRSLDDGQGVHRLSLATGAGAIRRDGQWLPLAQLALSWGRGLDRPNGGWMTVQTQLRLAGKPVDPALPASEAQAALLTPDFVWKTDATLGLGMPWGLTLIQDLRLEDRPDLDFSAKYAPSLVADVPGPLRLQLGVVQPLTGPGEAAIRLGSWIEF